MNDQLLTQRGHHYDDDERNQRQRHEPATRPRVHITEPRRQ